MLLDHSLQGPTEPSVISCRNGKQDIEEGSENQLFKLRFKGGSEVRRTPLHTCTSEKQRKKEHRRRREPWVWYACAIIPLGHFSNLVLRQYP